MSCSDCAGVYRSCAKTNGEYRDRIAALTAENEKLKEVEATARVLTEKSEMLTRKYIALHAENEKLRNFIKSEIDHNENFLPIAQGADKTNMKMFIMRAKHSLEAE